MTSKSLVAVTLTLTLGTQSAFAFDHVWSDTHGGSNSEYPFAVSANAFGALAVIGYFWGTVDFGGGAMTSAGSSDIFVARYNADGSHEWSKRLGSAGGDAGLGVVIDDLGEVVLTGYVEGPVDFGGGSLAAYGGTDIFMAKYDTHGGHVWSKRFGSTEYESGADVALSASGHVILTGYIGGAVDFGGGIVSGPGGSDTFIAKFDYNGDHIWSAAYGGTDTDTGWKLACDGNEVVLAGYFWDTADYGGGTMTSAGVSDIYVAKYDASGNHMWSMSFGSAQDDQPGGVAVDGAGRIALTGYFHDTVDFGGGGLTSVNDDDIFLAQYDENGSHLWSDSYGGVGKDEVYGVAIDSQNRMTITGGFPNSIDFGGGLLTREGSFNEVFLATFDSLGAHVWSEKYGSPMEDDGRGISIDGDDNIIITGIHEDDIDFGGGPLTNLGFFDVFVAKFQLTPATFAPHTGSGTPARYELAQNMPNPFNPATTIRYAVPPAGGHVTLKVFTVTGMEVKTLVDGPQAPGEQDVVWYGRDNRGNDVASGVYLYRMTAPGFDLTKRMVLLR